MSAGSSEHESTVANGACCGQAAIYPLSFSEARRNETADVYLADPRTQRLANFFERKGLAAIKLEDQKQQWYDDWLSYQAEHQIYASMLAPREFSALGVEFDLLAYTRFLEVFAYFSPAHGYSLQVTFLGLFSILMGSNTALKKEAVAALENGALLALGVSERSHGSDLLANEFTLTPRGADGYLANGSKYYIGNANAAPMISILAGLLDAQRTERGRPRTPVLFVLRPPSAKGFRHVGKIHTLGVRAAHVGAFEVKDHLLPETDVIAQGRQAWDAVFGTVTLGKFFLGFGSIGICEHALEEAVDHLRARVLYGGPVLEMPHIRALTSQAYVRLTAMKLYAYRALDYVEASCAADRRYLLFCAVQKARVSAEGVKVVALLSECVGAKGFESDTYFEMALRDVQLIPSLEGSAHINLLTANQFVPRYFGEFDRGLVEPASLFAGEQQPAQNTYLAEARSGALASIGFPPCMRAYGRFKSLDNVRLFARQVRNFRKFLGGNGHRQMPDDTQVSLAIGSCLATIVYAQLVAENSQRLGVGRAMISAIFQMIVSDLSAAALALAALPQLDAWKRVPLRRMVVVPRTTRRDWDAVAARMNGNGAAAD